MDRMQQGGGLDLAIRERVGTRLILCVELGIRGAGDDVDTYAEGRGGMRLSRVQALGVCGLGA